MFGSRSCSGAQSAANAEHAPTEDQGDEDQRDSKRIKIGEEKIIQGQNSEQATEPQAEMPAAAAATTLYASLNKGLFYSR